MTEDQLALAGIKKVYDYTQYSHENHVNVIPEQDFKQLIHDSFNTIADILRNTYGPYGSNVMLCTETNETYTTKDGYNVFGRIAFSQPYKRLVYLAIQNIINRVNENVGDGTTSCILLADKMFNALDSVIKTKDDKRNVIPILNDIECVLTDQSHVRDDIDDNIVKILTKDALYGLIRLAANYDDNLTGILLEALDPVIEQETKRVISVRNVVVDSRIDIDGSAAVTQKFTVEYLPGDYRIHVEMQPECALLFETPRKIRVAVYDHGFNSSDWNFFMDQFDRTTETLIISRHVNASILDHEYLRYCKDCALTKSDLKIMFANIKGDYLQDEIKDLCAAIGTSPIGLHAQAVDHESLPTCTIQVCKGNIMCFDMPNVPTDYIENLKAEMKADLSGSMVRHSLYKERIRALMNTSKDTIISVKASNSLEEKMLGDKIDDCLHIVNSAIEFGIVPNLFSYGIYRITKYRDLYNENDMQYDVANAIITALHGLFKDIWVSKHGTENELKLEAIQKELYKKPTTSFDIIHEAYVPVDQLPTSSQYDLEVISATIEIVKYLLDSRACIFGTNLLQPMNDTGHYSSL